jgi:hypothetical protein
MKVENCGESSTKSNCDCSRKLMMKHKYINEMKLSVLTQGPTTGQRIGKKLGETRRNH